MAQDQITEYVHLDPWGQMLGEDVGGTTCFYGKSKLTNTSWGARKYCERVYGYAGPVLIAANGNTYMPWASNTEFGLDFKRCRYFTHDAMAMLRDIGDELNDDGTTKDGCVDITPITQADPDRKCPTRWWNWDELGLLYPRGAAAGLLLLLRGAWDLPLLPPQEEGQGAQEAPNLPPPTA